MSVVETRMNTSTIPSVAEGAARSSAADLIDVRAATSSMFESVEPVLLSTVEDIFWRLEEYSAGAFRVVAVFRLDGCIEADVLKRALEQLQRRHPKLRAVIAQGSDGRRRFEFPPAAAPIPFSIKDYDDREFPWREETRCLLRITLPAAGALAAVTVLRSRTRRCCELLLTVAHAIADGVSAIMLVHDLLTEYAIAEANGNTPPRPILSPVSIGPARSGGWLRQLRLFRRVLRLQLEERRLRWTPLPEAPGIPPQTQWVHWVFSREDTLRLVRRCRQEQASLNGAMVAAVCAGLTDCLPVSHAMFKCQFPFDLRGQLEGLERPITGEDLGCFASMMNEFYRVQQQPQFWHLARRAHQDLHAFVKLGGPSFNYNLAMAFERLSAATSAARRLFGRATSTTTSTTPKRPTLLATNYGVPDIRDAYGSLLPRECTLMFKNDDAGPSLIMEALVMGQRLNIGLAAEGLEPEFWERFQRTVRKYLDAAAAGSGEAPVNRDVEGQRGVTPQRMSVAPQE